VDEGTAEEFFGRLLADATILHEASVRFAADRDDVSAMACILGADIATLEAVVWERLNIAPRAPQRQFFQAVHSVSGAVSGAPDGEEDDPGNLAAMIEGVRERMLTPFDAGLAEAVLDQWGPIEHLRSIPSPTRESIDVDLATRLEGLTPQEFIRSRRAAAVQTMLDAQEKRVRGSVPQAIQAAFESDFLGLEAYLVESAMAVGDEALLTVVTRQLLAGRAVADLTNLPADFMDAVSDIRGALADGLGKADGARLRDVLVAL
jgi:hypothetical protein